MKYTLIFILFVFGFLIDACVVATPPTYYPDILSQTHTVPSAVLYSLQKSKRIVLLNSVDTNTVIVSKAVKSVFPDKQICTITSYNIRDIYSVNNEKCTNGVSNDSIFEVFINPSFYNLSGINQQTVNYETYFVNWAINRYYINFSKLPVGLANAGAGRLVSWRRRCSGMPL